MTFGSLFAGIGGMDLGLERAGMVCKWQVEIDPFCQRVLAKHWPGVKRYGDISELTGKELERVDCIAGGFPCQDVSAIGLRRGVEAGERSGLYREMLRLVRHLRPRFVLMENVSGLFVDGLGRGPGGKHAGCDYFVLDLMHDKHAKAALMAYAVSCAMEFPLLARDLRLIVSRMMGGRG